MQTYESFEQAHAEFDDPLHQGKCVRADLALIGDGRRGRYALVIEVQLGVDFDKEWSMDLYRAALRRRERCPTRVLVISPDGKVRAAFFDRMFLTEPELRPLVIEPAMVPIIRDLTLAIAHYPLAVLAAVFHATGPDAVLCATLAIRALLAVVPEDYGRYIQMISELVGDDVMQQVREQLPPQDEAELSEIERRGSAFTRGRREGIEQGFHLGLEQGIGQGLEQGLERGLEQGIERGIEQMQTTLRNILAARGLATPPQILARIAACESIDELSSMLVRAATIDSADQLFSD